MKKALLASAVTVVLILSIFSTPSFATDLSRKTAKTASLINRSIVGTYPVNGKDILNNIVISKPGKISVVNDPGQCGAVVKLITPYAYDVNGSPVTVTNDAPAYFNVGTTVVIWTATDTLGNFDTTTQKITVIDNELPTIQVTNVSVSNDLDKCGAIVNIGTPVTADNCGVVSVTNNAPAFFPVGTTLVTWTVTDKAGYTNTAIQSVTVTDSQKPLIKAPSTITVYVSKSSGSVSNLNLGTPVTSDNCGVQRVSNNAPATFYVGTTYVTWIVTDLSGSTASAVQKVVVKVGSTRKRSNATEPDALISGKTFRETESLPEELKIIVAPNPSAAYFTLRLESKYNTPMMLRVTDALGRLVDARSKLAANTTLQIGHNYRAGSYFAEVIQGPQHRVVQLIKLK